ncbi:hypothetical protein QJS04_geneDACA000252 [Acorus gramineus]|uniref:RING/U-box superfamily protein n=1 Tax=Acorus gramineus TaxID=55184 RepID=A0AAV9AQM5_ACOGR|nr:hypothetical protein QJS04_geneDACA000252 [Acorus gramineus]
MTDLKHGPSVSAAEAEFRRGLEELVRDHLHDCLAAASCSSSAPSPRESGGASAADEEEDEGGDQLARRRRRSDLEAGGGEDDDDEPSSSAARRRRHSRILSRWAARRAEEMMIDTIERRNRESELLALAGLHTVSMLDSSFLRRDNPHSNSRSQSSDRPPIASRASSLLRQWREIEDETAALDRARARISRRQQDHRLNDVSERSESEWSDGVSRDRPMEVESRDSSREQSPDVGDGERERVRQIVRGWMNEEEPSPRESQQHGENSPRRAAASEVLGETERERVRLVREWVQMAQQRDAASTGSNGDQVNHAGRDGSVTDHEEGQPEHVRRDLLRLRGRQARLDLIVRMVRERERELQGLSEHRAVSDFAHRNRIQSLLRGRFLRNGSSVEEERPPSVAARELGQLRQRHPVSGIREGFRFRLENIVRGQASTHSDSSAGNNIREGRNDQSQLNTTLDVLTENQDEAPSNGEDGDIHPMQEANREVFESTNVHDLDWQESAIQGSDWQDRLTENGITDWQASTEARYDDWHDGSGEEPDSNWQENVDQDWPQEAPEDEDGEDSQVPEAHEEWHEDVSQEAAREWQDEPPDPPRIQRVIPIRRLNRFHPPDDESVYSMELRELLSRRSVSNLLRSGFRESLDQLIQSYVQRQTRSTIDWDLQETMPTPASPEQDEEQQRDVADEDQEDTIARPPRVPPSPPVPPPQPLWNQDLHHTQWPRHSMHRSDIEWDVINDLRADMNRLQQGMSHMQRMLEACMDMQLELQRSVRQEVSAALNRSSGGQDVGEGSSVDGSKWSHVRKGTCCVCCDSHIDSLLYRGRILLSFFHGL